MQYITVMRMFVPCQDVGILVIVLFGNLCLSINIRAYSVHVVKVMLILLFWES